MDDSWLSLSDLSPTVLTQEDLLVAFRSFFDGGNQADASQYKTLTLSALTGTKIQTDHLEKQWRKNLIKHGADFLHTTDLFTFNRPFNVGWDLNKACAFCMDCVSIIERCRARPELDYHGVLPISVTIPLHDFKRALAVNPDIGTPEFICVNQCLSLCVRWAEEFVGAHKFQLYFDQGEPFYGHVYDRKHNKRSRAYENLWARVIHLGQSNMRHTPCLQAADLVAWAIGIKHERGILYDWQGRLLDLHRESHVLEYAVLIKPDTDALRAIGSFKLPRRKRFKLT